MNLSEQYAERILTSMFSNYDFPLVHLMMISFDIKTKNLDLENNQITLHLSRIVEESNQITVEIYKRSEDYQVVGIYYISENQFNKSYDFCETMFTEHLLV